MLRSIFCLLIRLQRVGLLMVLLFVVLIPLVMLMEGTPVLMTALERMFVYFPERVLDTTPDAIGREYRDLQLQSADGTGLHGWFLPAAKAHWTCLYLHGNGGNIAGRLLQAQALREAGCQTLLLDYRGYGQSTGRPDELGLYQDAEAAYRWLVQEEQIEPRQIVVYGESLGGAIAIYLAGQVPVGALIVQSTFTSLRDMASLTYPWTPFPMIAGARYPSLARMPGITVPKLIIHGTRDDTIPFAMGEALYRVAGEPRRFYPVPGATHNDVFEVGGGALVTAIRDFLKAAV